MKNLYLIGSGGLGREIFATLKSSGYLKKYKAIFFIDKGSQEFINDILDVGTNEYLIDLGESCDVFIAISNPVVRNKIILQLQPHTHINFPTFIHPKSSIYDNERVKIGKGSFISEGCILTTDIVIGDYCYLNMNVTLHHDTVIEDNVFLMDGVRITGGAKVNRNSYICNNYSIDEAIVIPENTIIKIKND